MPARSQTDIEEGRHSRSSMWLSHGASARMPLLALFFLLAPVFAHADLININTADAALLDTLPGIGPTKATAIVDYRNANGLFARVEDIQNVSGIGPSTYTQIAPFITVGTSANSSQMATTTGTMASSTPPSTGVSAYTPPPGSLTIDAGSDALAIADVPLALTARVKTTEGGSDPVARIRWSFGDGSAGEGVTVRKTYRYPGTYLVVVSVSDGAVSARDDLAVTVRTARARIVDVTTDGITVANDSSDRLDISGWRIATGDNTIYLPEGTTLLPSSSVLLPFEVLHMRPAASASLFYPSGVIVSHFERPAMQPSGSAERSSLVQEELTSPVIEPHDAIQAVSAPRERTNSSISRGAAMAAVTPAIEDATTAEAAPLAGGLSRSSWLYGLGGILLLVGGAFIFL